MYVQRCIRMASKIYMASDDMNENKITHAALKKSNHLANLPMEILGLIKKWADAVELVDNAGKAFQTYDQLVKTADQAISREKGKGFKIKPIEGLKIGIGSYDPTKYTPSEKIERLSKLSQHASFVVRHRYHPYILDQANQIKMSIFGHKFSVGHTSNLLLGGPSVHRYEDLIKGFKVASGLGDAQTARLLLLQLQGASNAFSQLPWMAQEYGLKLYALFVGPEARRSGANLVAVVGVLNRVISEGLDLYKAMRQTLLFVASEKDNAVAEGGAKRSQSSVKNKDVSVNTM